MMSYRTRLYLAFTAIAMLALVTGSIHLFSSSYFRKVEERERRQERIVLLGHQLLEANQALHALVHDCISAYRLACMANYDASSLQRERLLDELTHIEDAVFERQALEVLRTKIILTTHVEKQVLARVARGGITGAEKLFDRTYEARQADIQHQIQSFQAAEEQEAMSTRAYVQKQIRVLDIFNWIASGATLLLAVVFVLYFGKKLARPVEALVASEARYASLFESSRDALLTLTPPFWRIATANRAAVQLFGATHVADLIALSPEELSPAQQPDGRTSDEKAQETIAIALREGSHFFEWELLRLNGETFTGDVLLTRMQEEDKLYLQTTVRDISQRKKNEAKLRLFRSLLDQSSDGVQITDPVSARFLDINDTVCRHLGYSRSELLGMTVFDVTVGYDRAMFDALVVECKTHGHVTVSAMSRRKDGSTYPVEVHVSYVSLDRDYLLATTHDISARMRADAEKELLLKRLDEFATHDQLTGVWNRRQFDDLLIREMARARRYQQPLSLIMFDIDHFKDVNDIHGHLAGDDLLSALAIYVSANTRDTDTLARWGGEEFMLIMPNTELADAVRFAEKLRSLIECGDFGSLGRITCSFGVALFREGDTPDNFTNRADTAMYVAKHNGRNRVARDEDAMKSIGDA